MDTERLLLKAAGKEASGKKEKKRETRRYRKEGKHRRGKLRVKERRFLWNFGIFYFRLNFKHNLEVNSSIFNYLENGSFLKRIESLRGQFFRRIVHLYKLLFPYNIWWYQIISISVYIEIFFVPILRESYYHIKSSFIDAITYCILSLWYQWIRKVSLH